jgi:hypothetical protein
MRRHIVMAYIVPSMNEHIVSDCHTTGVYAARQCFVRAPWQPSKSSPHIQGPVFSKTDHTLPNMAVIKDIINILINSHNNQQHFLRRTQSNKESQPLIDQDAYLYSFLLKFHSIFIKRNLGLSFGFDG